MFVVDDWGKHLVGPTRARLHAPFIFFVPFLVFVLLNMDHGGQELVLSYPSGFILSYRWYFKSKHSKFHKHSCVLATT